MIQVANSRLLHRKIAGAYPVAVRAEGLRITDSEGRVYLDGVSGAAVCSLGYGDAKVIEAVQRQVADLAFMHSASFATEIAESLARRLTEICPEFGRVYLVSGGSEAMETALKIARQHAVLTGRAEAWQFAARDGSYHGATLATLAVGGSAARRALYEPLLPFNVVLPRCYPYRDQAEGESEAQYCERLLAETDAALRTAGPQRVLAVVVEPVSGAVLGAATPPQGYLAGLRRICDQHGLLLIFDEVMCGMGRTGAMFAYQAQGVTPDILVAAKGLGAGYQPIGATLVSRRIYDAFASAGTAFEHGHTYIGHATACAAAHAVLDRLVEDGVLAGVPTKSEHFFSALHKRLGQHPHVGDIRGCGLLVGVELVSERGTKTPFAKTATVSARLKQRSMDNGLVCYPVGGFIDGTVGDHILLAPAFTATLEDLDEIVDRLARSIQEVTGEG